jgi:hypothetical protein
MNHASFAFVSRYDGADGEGWPTRQYDVCAITITHSNFSCLMRCRYCYYGTCCLHYRKWLGVTRNRVALHKDNRISFYGLLNMSQLVLMLPGIVIIRLNTILDCAALRNCNQRWEEFHIKQIKL